MEKVFEKLEKSLEKWSDDLVNRPISTVIKAAIVIWIMKHIYKWLKD